MSFILVQEPVAVSQARRGRSQSCGRGRGRGRGCGRRGRRQASTPSRSRSPQQNEWVSRSGRRWTLVAPNSAVRRSIANIVRERPGPRGAAASANRMHEILRSFITDEMIDLIVKHTNEEGTRECDSWNGQHPDKQVQYKATDAVEIWAMIGLMLLRGIYAGYE